MNPKPDEFKWSKPFDGRMIFGFLILIVFTSLSLIIALGKVERESSYGLEIVLGSLATLAGQFAAWAFRGRNSPAKEQQHEEPAHTVPVPIHHEENNTPK